MRFTGGVAEVLLLIGLFVVAYAAGYEINHIITGVLDYDNWSVN